MPRNAGVSGLITVRFNVLRPSARTMTLCLSGVQIVLFINLILIVPGILNLIQRQAAQIGDLGLIAQLFQCIDGRLNHVVRIMRTERLG
jgi:hypothetical protein